jgi:predicted nucleic acid-binding protein
MIVVDTSVWVEVTRRPQGAKKKVLDSLLDADEVALALPVRAELMAGVASRDRAAFQRALSALPVLMPTEETWQLLERWIPTAADKGQRFAVTDLLIAALASDIGALVWSLDDDFERLERVGLVQLYDPPGG